MIPLVKKDYDSTKIYRKTQKKGASQTYDTPSSWQSENVSASLCVINARISIFTNLYLLDL